MSVGGLGPDYCVFINGGQACTFDGVTTIGCDSAPVFVTDSAESPGSTVWEQSPLLGKARGFFRTANGADPRYQTGYASAWAQLIAEPLGAPRNNAVYNVWVFTGSAPQPDLRTLYDALIDQPQGAVAPSSTPPPPDFPE